MKRSISLLLVALLLSSVLSACSTPAETTSDPTDTATTAGEAETTAEPATESKLEPSLPDKDFEGQTINFLVKGEEHHWYWCSKEIYAEAENGDQLNDAVYKRNRYLEDKYNFRIAETRSADPKADAIKSIKADDKLYDVVMTGLLDGGSMAQSGYLTDLKTVPNLNLSQPWWDQRAVSDLSIGNKLFFALGDINVMDNDATWALIFNKKLIADYDLGSPYDLVRNSAWTMDAYYEMMRAVSRDVNTDGKFDGEDILGQLTDADNTYGLFIGGGGRIIAKDANDYPVFNMNNDKSIAIIGKALEIMLDTSTNLLANDYHSQYSNPWDELTRPMFLNNQGLFYAIGMGTVQLLRNMEADFGLLPMPLYNSEQKEYYNVIQPGSTSSLMIPTTNDRLEFTGHVVEAIAAESMYTLTPAYYDVNFVKKAIRDEDSIDMLEIILRSRTFDLGNIFDWGQTSGMLYEMTNSKSTDFVSIYEKREARAITAMEKTVTAFKELG